jgi:hypothetical protein
MTRCRPWILLLLLGASGPTSAQTDAGRLEFPDGSVGEGGADRDQQEAEDRIGRVPVVCHSSIECNGGFECQEGRCTWVGTRKAEGGFGCGGLAAAGLLPLSVAFSARRRSRSRSWCSAAPDRTSR